MVIRDRKRAVGVFPSRQETELALKVLLKTFNSGFSNISSHQL